MGREGGRTALSLLVDIEKLPGQLGRSNDPQLIAIAEALATSAHQLRKTVEWVSETYPANPAAVAAASVYVLKLMGITLGVDARALGTGRCETARRGRRRRLPQAKILTARFFGDHVMAQAPAPRRRR
jgi:acyl-CoA dehydrogenase